MTGRRVKPKSEPSETGIGMQPTTQAVSAVYGEMDQRESHALPFSCRCGTRWSGLRTAHCGACHRTFTGVTGFDAHRRDGACLDPTSIGMEPKTRTGHTAYGRPGADDIDWGRA